jgi:hypothetical protein
MAVDLSGITLIAPIIAYLLVFLVSAAILFKTEVLGDNKWVQIFVSLFIASLFVAFAGTREYVLTIVPWFAVLLVSLFFVLFLVGFMGGSSDFMKKGIGIAVIVVLGLIFLVSGFVVFSDVIVNYLPGPDFGAGDENATLLFSWLYSPRVLGAILLVVVSAIAAWILVKSS